MFYTFRNLGTFFCLIFLLFEAHILDTKHSAAVCGFELYGYVMCITSGFTFVEEQVKVTGLFGGVEAFC